MYEQRRVRSAIKITIEKIKCKNYIPSDIMIMPRVNIIGKYLLSLKLISEPKSITTYKSDIYFLFLPSSF